MGRYCHIRGDYLPNERFSGKGHRRGVCKECARLPKAELFRIETISEMWGFVFDQSRISKKNRNRLKELCESDDPVVRETAELVLAIARAHPQRRRRHAVIKARHPELWERMVQAHMVDPDSEEQTENSQTDSDLDFTTFIDGPRGTRYSDEEIPF